MCYLNICTSRTRAGFSSLQTMAPYLLAAPINSDSRKAGQAWPIEDPAMRGRTRFSRKKMELPQKGKEVPLPKIKEICGFYGLHDLWAKIEKDPPPIPFKSDGCSMWFDSWKGISLYPACFLHDLKYWAGYPGEALERLIADADLMIDVARLLDSTHMAEIMFHGVRIGGHEIFKRSFSWGFGRIT